jgi:Iap family predicted aminopeptidase
MTQQLSAYKRAKRVAGAARPGVGIQAFVLDGPTDRKVVVWTADNTSKVAASPSPVSSAVVDVFGTAVQNNPTMTFTGSPIYFTTQATDAQLAAWAATL